MAADTCKSQCWQFLLHSLWGRPGFRLKLRLCSRVRVNHSVRLSQNDKSSLVCAKKHVRIRKVRNKLGKIRRKSLKTDVQRNVKPWQCQLMHHLLLNETLDDQQEPPSTTMDAQAITTKHWPLWTSSRSKIQIRSQVICQIVTIVRRWRRWLNIWPSLKPAPCLLALECAKNHTIAYVWYGNKTMP